MTETKGVGSAGVAAFAADTTRALVTLLVLAAPVAPARASDDEIANQPVLQRRHTDYEPIGILANGWLFYPRITAGVTYDSNVFASPVDAADDWALVLTPELRAVAARGDATYQFDVGAKHYAYRTFDSEDRTDAHARFRLTKQIAGDVKWDAAFEAARRHELRGDSFALTDAAEPIPYHDLRAETAVTKTFNRFGVTVGGRIRNLSYEDVDAFGGGTLEQGFRDGMIYTTTFKPFYEFSPGYKAYARIDLSRRDYAGEGTENRDSQGYDARGGLDFRLTPVLFGSAELGYLAQEYDNPLIPQAEGVAAAARIMWLMTPLMTVSFFAERSVSEMASPEQEARLDFLAGAQVDYEILRNLILSVEAAFKNEEFSGTERSDDIVKITAKLDYLINRRLNMGIHYNYLDRASTNEIYDFSRHVVTLNVTAQH